MNLRAIKTKKLRLGSCSVVELLEESLGELNEGSVVALSSKVISLCEGRAVKVGDASKDDLIEAESERFLAKKLSRYGLYLTIKDSTLIPNAGIDESNADGHYVLWPANAQKTANEIRRWLGHRYGLKRVGVIITDSFCVPMRLGTIGLALAHSGFKAVDNYIGKPDLFGRKLMMSQSSVAGGLAAAAVLVMGEGAQQTPILVIDDLPFVAFQRRNPTVAELNSQAMPLEDDLFAPLLQSAEWRRGGAGRK